MSQTTTKKDRKVAQLSKTKKKQLEKLLSHALKTGNYTSVKGVFRALE